MHGAVYSPYLCLEQVGHAGLAGQQGLLVSEELLGGEPGLLLRVGGPGAAPERVADREHPAHTHPHD